MSSFPDTMTGGELLAPGLTGLRELGGGESYEAWLAFDERLLAPVVVKIVRPQLVDDAPTLAAYRRELELLSSLAHPGIARLFAYDDEAERPYLVIEHVDGPTLSSLISRFGHLPEHQLLAVAVDLGSALHTCMAGVCATSTSSRAMSWPAPRRS